MTVATLTCVTTTLAMSRSTPAPASAAPQAAVRVAPRVPSHPRRHHRPGRVDPVRHALRIAAATYGVPEAKLRRVAMCESTLNPAARNGRYVGLFQFGLPLWRKTPYGRFSRTDPHAAALAAAWAFSRGMHRNWPVCGYR